MTTPTNPREYLAKWTTPKNYFGEEWREYYSAGVGQSRDSDCLEQSNFSAMLRDLGGESETVIVVRENHWAVGWVEWIAIHETDAPALAVAAENVSRLRDYPILDEDDYSEREWQEAERVWADCYRPHERAEYFRRHRVTTGFRELRAAVAGDWSAAANLLPCPMDIIR